MGGCNFTYLCAAGSVCVAPSNTCAGYNTQLCARLIVGTHVYLVCDGNGGWNDSNGICTSTWPGFQLGSIRNQAEMTALSGFLSAGKGWIGLTDRPERSVEGVYVWADGSPFTFGSTLRAAPWCSGQPDNGGGGEDCIEFNADNDCWNDTECGNSRGFICAR